MGPRLGVDVELAMASLLASCACVCRNRSSYLSIDLSIVTMHVYMHLDPRLHADGYVVVEIDVVLDEETGTHRDGSIDLRGLGGEAVRP